MQGVFSFEPWALGLNELCRLPRFGGFDRSSGFWKALSLNAFNPGERTAHGYRLKARGT